MLSEEKLTRYRKVKIRAVLIQEDNFDDNKIKTLKFVEVNDIDDMKKHKVNSIVEEKEQIKSTSGQKEEQKINTGVERSIEDLEKSERESNISGSSVNEELRTLKDFKTLISEKNVPKSIRILKRTIIVLGMILIILTGKFN